LLGWMMASIIFMGWVSWDVRVLIGGERMAGRGRARGRPAAAELGQTSL
jgi:hypothetical protein